MKNVLIVEGDKNLQGLLNLTFQTHGFRTILADDGAIGYEKFLENPLDIIVTDVVNEHLDGFLLIEEVRKKNKTVPIIVIAAQKTESDELKAFNCGANDFIVKPFGVEILMKRVENLLNLVNLVAHNSHLTNGEGELELNRDRQSVYTNGKEVRLTKKEFVLLDELLSNSGKSLTRDYLLIRMWGKNYYGDSRNIDTHVKNLRRKLQTSKIVTIKGRGYMYEERNEHNL